MALPCFAVVSAELPVRAAPRQQGAGRAVRRTHLIDDFTRRRVDRTLPPTASQRVFGGYPSTCSLFPNQRVSQFLRPPSGDGASTPGGVVDLVPQREPVNDCNADDVGMRQGRTRFGDLRLTILRRSIGELDSPMRRTRTHNAVSRVHRKFSGLSRFSLTTICSSATSG